MDWCFLSWVKRPKKSSSDKRCEDRTHLIRAWQVMKIQIARIPNEGIHLRFTEKDSWIVQKLSRALGELYHPVDPVVGRVSVYETMDNLSIQGELSFLIHPVCARCMEVYKIHSQLPIRRLLVPMSEGHPEKADSEDEGVGFYEGAEIDVGEMISEQVVLDQPMIYLCKPDCRGLCLQCGANRNLKECPCRANFEKSPFGVLKKA